MPRGGRRPGAGRKPKGVYPPIEDVPKLIASGVIEIPKLEYLAGEAPPAFAQRVLTEHFPKLLHEALTRALKDGNDRMLIYLTDRLLGSPVQPIDLEIRRVAERLAADYGLSAAELIREAEEIVARG